ncbi:dioxygenase [Bifidobacterium sp. ESL0784]|uniref:dioxygenase n=1 Tax=Bifidobacterium sp. ESL0784 TaxID=2983231 RepID=UPI0023F7F84B|nr:dioxygenase [Bifidobacterium sp. ESL0784]MDF7641481.1 dioxygenase [Bifidobacterium sp. ESL0784]
MSEKTSKELANPFIAIPIENPLSSPEARIPVEMEDASGILLQGKRLRSFAYTTDAAVIHNTNADAILAVYPFTGQPVINQAILSVAQAPVFVGVGGGTTSGPRVAELAVFAEMQGVAGVVVNAPIDADMVNKVASIVHIPVVATVLDDDETVDRKIEAGARIINVAAGRNTPEIVARIKERYPNIPLIASSGGDPGSVRATINAGANALTWTPPSAQMLQKAMMDDYRHGRPAHHGSGATMPAETPATYGSVTTSNSSAPQNTDNGHIIIDTNLAHAPRHKLKNQLDGQE